MKRQRGDWKTIFTKHVSARLVYKIKNHYNSINIKNDRTKQKMTNVLNGKILTDILPKICNWHIIIHKYTLHYWIYLLGKHKVKSQWDNTRIVKIEVEYVKWCKTKELLEFLSSTSGIVVNTMALRKRLTVLWKAKYTTVSWV